MFRSSKVSKDGKEISINDYLGDEIEKIINESREDHCPNLPLKRNWDSYMETFGRDLTQPSRSRTQLSFNMEPLQDNKIGVVPCIEILDNPQESTTSSNDSLIREAKKSVGRFLYKTGMGFDVVQSPNFENSIFRNCGVTKDQIPTLEELKGWIFHEAIKEMCEYVNGMRNSWSETGCSVLVDGWTDANGRLLINILVDCPRGTVYLRSCAVSDYLRNMDVVLSFFDQVIQDVGTENVVQIITCLTSKFMKEIGEKLVKRHRLTFWTVSVSSCIDLMLQKMEKMDLVMETLDKTKSIARFIHGNPNVLQILKDHTGGRGLIKTSKIRSALPFLTLENIVSEGRSLKKMFLSSIHESSILTSTAEGKMVAEWLQSKSFWSYATTVLQATIPLVRLMEWMNENKAQMGYIYETLDQAKETIKEGCKRKESEYKPFWNIIDNVWEKNLHSPLHSLGYYLNPSLFYSSDVHIDKEVTTGLLQGIVRASNDLHVIEALSLEVEMYANAEGAFGLGCTVNARSDILPVLWWFKYGSECPELQRVAIRILNQTCDGASKFQLKRSLAEAFLTSGENQKERQSLSDMAFLHYNFQLQSFASGKSVSSLEFDPMKDWILNRTQNDVSLNGGDITGI